MDNNEFVQISLDRYDKFKENEKHINEVKESIDKKNKDLCFAVGNFIMNANKSISHEIINAWMTEAGYKIKIITKGGVSIHIGNGEKFIEIQNV